MKINLTHKINNDKYTNYIYEAFDIQNKDEPYVIVVPFKNINGDEKIAIDFLDIKNAKMLYINKDNQFNQWLSGHRYIGVTPKKQLLSINYK